VRPTKRSKETALTRTIDDVEIKLFWSCIMSPAVSKAVGLALKLALPTGLRGRSLRSAYGDRVTGPHDIPERFNLVLRRTTRSFPVASSSDEGSGSVWPSTCTGLDR